MSNKTRARWTTVVVLHANRTYTTGHRRGSLQDIMNVVAKTNSFDF